MPAVKMNSLQGYVFAEVPKTDDVALARLYRAAT
jgi:hypothetical protein